MIQQASSCCFLLVESRSTALFTQEPGVSEEIWSTETRLFGFSGLEDLQCTAAFIQETGLLLFMAVVHVIAEAKTYNKIICKISDLGKDDQVTVEKGDELIAQCFYHEGKCSNTPNTVGRLTEQWGDLVLIIQNINPLDHYDAYRWVKNVKTLLKSFTRDEVLPTTATPDQTDEALNPSITQTVPPIFTTPLPIEGNRKPQREPATFHGTKAFQVALGASALFLVLVFIIKCERAGQDGRWKDIIAFPRKRSVPNQHDENSMEMQSLAVLE